MDKQTGTILLVAAAVVGVVWYMRRQPAMRRMGGPVSTGTSTVDYGQIAEGVGKGLGALIGSFESFGSTTTTLPAETQTSFIGTSCSADYNCGFGESCVAGTCVPTSSVSTGNNDGSEFYA